MISHCGTCIQFTFLFWIHISKANIFTNKISMEHNISFKKLNGSAHTISNNLVYLADIDTID